MGEHFNSFACFLVPNILISARVLVRVRVVLNDVFKLTCSLYSFPSHL